MSKKVLKLILVVGLMFLLFIQPAFATIRESKIPPNILLYKSIQTWRDQSKNPWELIFFKEIKGDNKPKINLRLVGFPELFEFKHPQPLIIKIRDNLMVEVPDIFASDKESFSPNMGQYDFNPIIDRLETNSFWLLELPLKGGNSPTIKVPYFILEEWKKIIVQN